MNQSSVLNGVLFACAILPSLAGALPAQQRKPPTKRLFSEDFESGSIDESVWTQDITGDSVVEIQRNRMAHGMHALLVRCPAPAHGTQAFLLAKYLPEPLRHHHFGRAYMYLTPGIPDRHTIFLTARTTGFPKYKYQEVATAHGKFQLTFVNTTVTGPLGEDWHGGPELPIGRWFLLEWEFNDQPDQAAIWVDGEKIFETPFTFKTEGQSAISSAASLTSQSASNFGERHPCPSTSTTMT